MNNSTAASEIGKKKKTASGSGNIQKKRSNLVGANLYYCVYIAQRVHKFYFFIIIFLLVFFSHQKKGPRIFLYVYIRDIYFVISFNFCAIICNGRD